MRAAIDWLRANSKPALIGAACVIMFNNVLYPIMHSASIYHDGGIICMPML